MTLEKLQKALEIMRRREPDGAGSGKVHVSHDELHLWPMVDRFSPAEVSDLETLGFRMNDEGGFDCFV